MCKTIVKWMAIFPPPIPAVRPRSDGLGGKFSVFTDQEFSLDTSPKKCIHFTIYRFRLSEQVLIHAFWLYYNLLKGLECYWCCKNIRRSQLNKKCVAQVQV